MTNLTAFKWGYRREAIWGTSVITDPAHDAQKIGMMVGDQIHPTPRFTLDTQPPAYNEAEVSSAEKGNAILDGKYNFIAQNGIFLELILGKSVTAGPVGGIYTHTITPPTDGSLLPSFTAQLEMSGTAAPWNIQSNGVKASSIKMLTHATDFPSLLVEMVVQAKETDTTIITLTNTPALPSTAAKDGYFFGKLSREFDGVAIDGLESIELDIIAGIAPVHESTYDGATYDGMWPALFNENAYRIYRLKFNVALTYDTFWNELIARGNTKNLVLKWARDISDDYIEITCTNVHVLTNPIITQSGSALEAEIECGVESISCVVKDKITGTDYGE